MHETMGFLESLRPWPGEFFEFWCAEAPQFMTLVEKFGPWRLFYRHWPQHVWLVVGSDRVFVGYSGADRSTIEVWDALLTAELQRAPVEGSEEPETLTVPSRPPSSNAHRQRALPRYAAESDGAGRVRVGWFTPGDWTEYARREGFEWAPERDLYAHLDAPISDGWDGGEWSDAQRVHMKELARERRD